MKPIWILVGIAALVVITMLAFKTYPYGFGSKEGFQADAAAQAAAAQAAAAQAKALIPSASSMATPSPMATPPPMATPSPMATPPPMATPSPMATPMANTMVTPMATPIPGPIVLGAMPPMPPSPPIGTPAVPIGPVAQVAPAGIKERSGFRNMNDLQGADYMNNLKEGFATNYGETSAGAQDKYEPMGAFDGVTLPTGNNVSTWRYTAPNEKLLGAEFTPGDDSLFIFKNNQCKPECCGSSFSCSGGCVCTTPSQRQQIAARGGNRSKPQED